MKTIICGAGDVGYSIADKLFKENFEVTVIDESDERLSKVSDNLDVKIIKGIESLSHNSMGMIALENIPIIGTMITRFKILEPIIFPITI